MPCQSAKATEQKKGILKMALHWDFKKDKIGWYVDDHVKKMTENHGNVVRLYDGNALMIATWENDESNNYWMHSFFCDEEHAKNCLEDSLYPKEAIFHLYRSKPSAKKLARILTRYQISVIWEDEEQ